MRGDSGGTLDLQQRFLRMALADLQPGMEEEGFGAVRVVRQGPLEETRDILGAAHFQGELGGEDQHPGSSGLSCNTPWRTGSASSGRCDLTRASTSPMR